jgi:hypothetical protein
MNREQQISGHDPRIFPRSFSSVEDKHLKTKGGPTCKYLLGEQNEWLSSDFVETGWTQKVGPKPTPRPPRRTLPCARYISRPVDFR